MLNKKMLAAAIAAAAFAGVAQAEGFYAGAELGHAKAKAACDGVSGPGISCDDTDTVAKIYGGYSLNDNWSVEAGYRDLGEYSASGPAGHLKFEAKALDFAAVGHLPVSDSFSFYGKAGVTYWDAEVSGLVSDSARGFDPLLGVGAEWNLGVVSLTGGVERLFDIGDANKTSKDDLDVVSLGVKYNFK